MKKGPLHFLGRKNQSLFDTNVKMKDMDNVELVLDSGTILESGTASVRARPTVKHFSSSTDSFQGFAVPTPTVPLYAPGVNGTKFNGSVSDDQSSNGSTISVNDPIDGEIFVPPPPSVAPPPPPEVFLLPPPEFMGDLSTLQPTPMRAPKPPSQFVCVQEEDFAFMAPPPMSPPKPPSIGSSASSPVPISSPTVPEHPKYAPPKPPTEKQKTIKSPPPKPIRISSVPSMDLPPDSPAPPPPEHPPTLSTFNPQSPAKLYNSPKSTFLNGYEEQGLKPKPKLMLQDSGAGPTLQKEAKVPPKPSPKLVDTQEVTEIKPVIPKPVEEVKETETVPKMSVPAPPAPPATPATPPEPVRERKPITAATLKEFSKSPKTSSVRGSQDAKSEKLEKPDASPTLSGKYSPLIDRKLRGISGPSAPKDTSPLALLKAAKQRDKHRSMPHENKSYLGTTNFGSTLSLNSQEGQPESPKPEPLYATVNKSPVKSTVPSFSAPPPNQTVQATTLSKPDPLQVGDVKPDLDFLPPPPEFDDLEEIEPPPAMRPPDPPKMAAPTPAPAPPTPPKTPAQKPPITPVLPTQPKFMPAPPPVMQLPPDPPKMAAPTPAPAPPTPPKTPAQKPATAPVVSTPKIAPPPPPVPQLPPVSGTTVKAKPPPPVLAKPTPAQAPLPTAATPSQVTLLNILKKKMMEMDQKIGSDVSEESNMDDWGSQEESPVPVVAPKVNSAKSTEVNKVRTLDMNELQSKVAQKNHEITPNRIPIPTSNGPSRHQYGMTFTVRPGTKQPITLVHKGES